jgi:hypothetical protein
MAYSKELQNELNPLGSGDTIKFWIDGAVALQCSKKTKPA